MKCVLNAWPQATYLLSNFHEINAPLNFLNLDQFIVLLCLCEADLESSYLFNERLTQLQLPLSHINHI